MTRWGEGGGGLKIDPERFGVENTESWGYERNVSIPPRTERYGIGRNRTLGTRCYDRPAAATAPRPRGRLGEATIDRGMSPPLIIRRTIINIQQKALSAISSRSLSPPAPGSPSTGSSEGAKQQL